MATASGSRDETILTDNQDETTPDDSRDVTILEEEPPTQPEQRPHEDPTSGGRAWTNEEDWLELRLRHATRKTRLGAPGAVKYPIIRDSTRAAARVYCKHAKQGTWLNIFVTINSQGRLIKSARHAATQTPEELVEWRPPSWSGSLTY